MDRKRSTAARTLDDHTYESLIRRTSYHYFTDPLLTVMGAFEVSAA